MSIGSGEERMGEQGEGDELMKRGGGGDEVLGHHHHERLQQDGTHPLGVALEHI